MKINWKPIKEVAELVGGAVSYVVMIAAYREFMGRMLDSPDSKSAYYDDAVGAIMRSDMYSHDKADAIEALKRYGGSEFYRAIIHIANNNDMYSHDKVNMIKALSEK